MNNSIVILLIVLAIAIIAGLGIYAGKLLSQLKQQRQRQAHERAELLAGQKRHDIKIFDSVVIIVRAMKEEQCDFSEGCWRLSVLLDSLKTTTGLEEQFPGIYGLYNQIKHMQILEKRKSLPKKDRMKQDLERMKAETSFYEEINNDLSLLLQYAQERLSVLKGA